MKSLTKIAPIPLAVASVVGCAGSPLELETANHDKPFVFLYVTSGFTPPGASSGEGVLVAVWQDGLVIRSSHDEKFGTTYVEGRIDTHQLDELMRTIERSGLLMSHNRSRIVVDQKTERLVVRTKDGVEVWAHSPSVMKDTRIDEVRSRLLGLQLSSVARTNAERFKGYPREWFK